MGGFGSLSRRCRPYRPCRRAVSERYCCVAQEQERGSNPRGAGPEVFERSLPPKGWIYPCTKDELRAALAGFPPEHLEGLHAVGLAPATRKDCWANGRYFAGPPALIELYSMACDLTYKQSPYVKRHHIERGQAVEVAYGMRVERVGARFVCCWDLEPWKRFVLGHVLAHEVGHHVYRRSRRRAVNVGATRNPAESECFAEAYALRHGEGGPHGL